MLTLTINTASSLTSIALFNQGWLLQEISWTSSNNEAEKLMPEIEKMMNFNQAEYHQIKKVIVIKGPGSFTGLRVGIAVANTISYLNDCELKSIDTFNYFWHSVPEQEGKALLIFAGSKGVYVSLPGEEVVTLGLDELNDYLNKKNVQETFGDISATQKELLTVPFKSLLLSFGDMMVNIPSEAYTIEKIIKPNYVKDASITIGKNKLFN